MKRFKLFLVVLAVFLFASCASGNRNLEPEDDLELSLLEAIEQSAERLAAILPAKSRVVILAFESESNNLSDFIIEELTGALINQGFEAADRQNLEYVFNVLNLQVSGNINNVTAQSIGRFLGAQFVFTGQLIHYVDSYRYRINVINAERTTRENFTRFTVRDDEETTDMIAAINSRITTVRTSRYGVDEQTSPLTAGTFLDRGILFASRGDYDMAIADFTEAIRLNPNLIAAYLMRGRVLFASASDFNLEDIYSDDEIMEEHVKFFQQIIEDYTYAIRLDPYNANLFRERGLAYNSKGDLNSAIADFTQAIRMNPVFSEAFNDRGIAFSDREDYDRAIADFTQAIQLNPSFANAYFNRGNVFFEISDYDRAIADFEIVLLIEDDENARIWLENARQQRGR